MLKIVFDTTVLVSVFVLPDGLSFELIRRVKEDKCKAAACLEIFAEAAKTLLLQQRIRRKYKYEDEEVKDFLNELMKAFNLVSLPTDMPRVCRDPNDDMILACAVAAGADYIVTRDKDLLVMKKYQNVEILTPEKFIKQIIN